MTNRHADGSVCRAKSPETCPFYVGTPSLRSNAGISAALQDRAEADAKTKATPQKFTATFLKREIKSDEAAIAKHLKEFGAQIGGTSPVTYSEERVQANRLLLAGTVSGQKNLQERIDAETSPAKKKALEDLQAMAKENYDQKILEYHISKEKFAGRREENKTKETARKRREAALKILQQDSKVSVDEAKKKVVLPTRVAPTYSDYSYSSGKGGKR